MINIKQTPRKIQGRFKKPEKTHWVQKLYSDFSVYTANR